MLAGALTAQLATAAGAATGDPAVSAAPTYILAGSLLADPNGAVRGPSTIVVQDGRIVEVRDGFSQPPGTAEVIDLRDRFVLPGLIDAHVHLNGRGNPALARMDATGRDAEDVLVTMEISARDTLEAGFTTVRDLGAPPRGIRALRDAIDRGDVSGPSIVNAGQIISATAGHGDGANGLRADLAEAVHEHQVNTCDGPDDCRKAVRRQIQLGALVIKFAATGGATSNIAGGLGKQLTDEEMRAIVETAHSFGRKVAAHAHGADGIEAALRAGADSIEHGTFLTDEAIRLFRQTGAYFVPTMLAPVTTAEQARAGLLTPAAAAKVGKGESAIPNHRKAIAAGVKIAFGTDSGISRNGDNAREFTLMVDRGMRPSQAIAAATINGAALLGRSDSIGSIDRGKFADIIAVSGNPLQDVAILQSVEFVMKHGKVIKAQGKRLPFP
jgi:imidazolonepropionase-like amidohydrolase